jgi:predicted dehydrogenase
MLGDEGVRVVSVCTPTDTHVGIGLRVLEAGKHLLIEKPVALRVEGVQQLALSAGEGEGSGVVCMPAHCMRFWPGWPEAREIIRSGEMGRVRGVWLGRVGGVPDWNPSFYLDETRSGGVLFDLHVHDADYMLWCFGQPLGVRVEGKRRHFTAYYDYGEFVVQAETGWLPGDGVAFQMTYRIELDGGVLDFAYDRAEPLLLTTGGVTRAVPLDGRNAYESQAEHFLDVALHGATPRVTLADAERVVGLLRTTLRSFGVDPSGY